MELPRFVQRSVPPPPPPFFFFLNQFQLEMFWKVERVFFFLWGSEMGEGFKRLSLI